jgi:uncharacterized membrane protein YfcA
VPSNWTLGLKHGLTVLAIGLVAGLLSGLLGVGGGLVMVPAMVLFLRFSQHEAHGTSLAAILPIALAAVLVFGSADRVNVPAALLLAVGSIPGARLGAAWMRRLSELRLRRLFGLFLIGIAIVMLLQ